MKDLMLIKKILDKDKADEVYPVTFDLDKSFERSIAVGIFNDLMEKKIIKSKRFTIKDHSFTVDILPRSINEVIDIIIKKGMYIYGVYTLYDNYIEEGELK